VEILKEQKEYAMQFTKSGPTATIYFHNICGKYYPGKIL